MKLARDIADVQLYIDVQENGIDASELAGRRPASIVDERRMHECVGAKSIFCLCKNVEEGDGETKGVRNARRRRNR